MKDYSNKMLFTIVVLFVHFGCSDRFEEVNTNPNGISDIDPASLFANAVRESFRSGITSMDYQLAGQYAHFYVGVNNEHLIDQYNQDLNGGTYEGSFNSTYKNKLSYYNEILLLTGPGAQKENALQFAVADIMAVQAYAKLTDMFGAIPYFEGGFGNSGILLPTYDTQDVIYFDMIQRLSSDISVLKLAEDGVSLVGQDPLFNNNPDLWMRFANSLKLRLAMRMRHVEPAAAQQYITECLSEPLMTTNSHNAVLNNSDGDNSQLFSPWYGTFDFYKFRISDKVVSQLSQTNDPRLPIFANPLSNGTYRGLVNGLVDAEFARAVNQDHSYPSDYLVGKGSNLFLMAASEISFLRAEIALFGIGENDANAHFQSGITLNMQRAGVSEDDISTFLATPEGTLSGSSEEQFEQLSIQMWLALAPNFPEAYANMRRTGYPIIPIRDGIKTHKGVTNGELPSRAVYPLSEKLTNNSNVQQAINEMGGEDLLTIRLWWDVRR